MDLFYISNVGLFLTKAKKKNLICHLRLSPAGLGFHRLIIMILDWQYWYITHIG